MHHIEEVKNKFFTKGLTTVDLFHTHWDCTILKGQT